MGNYHVRFGGGRMEKEPQGHLVSRLPYDDVSVSIFARQRQLQGEAVTFYSASFSRSYKDAAGARKFTHSFDADDLGKLVTLAQQANEYIQDVREAHAA